MKFKKTILRKDNKVILTFMEIQANTFKSLKDKVGKHFRMSHKKLLLIKLVSRS